MESGKQKAKHAYTYDIVISGAGPAGTACALGLQNAGLRVALLDKMVFPRDKICGDAISTKAVKFLRQNYPDHATAFSEMESYFSITSTRFVSASGKEATVRWQSETCNCSRLQFDHFLFDLVKKNPDIDIHQDTSVKEVNYTDSAVELTTTKGIFKASIVICCDGAQSLLAKKLAGFQVDKKHYGAAVRAYFEMKGEKGPKLNEVFFSKKYPQGYLWIFPVSETMYNVGFGSLSHMIAKKKINLTNALFEIINEFPELKERFSTAELRDKVHGFGLSLGTRKLPISGQRFLLCGDAASLIDPVSGDGIGNALISGHLAAKHVLRNKTELNFSAEINKQYDEAVYSLLWKDFQKKTWALRMISRLPFLIGLGISLLSFRNRFSKN